MKYFESLEPQDAYTGELEEAVTAAREHREWRREYMQNRAWEWDIRREGREEGGIIKLVNLVYRKVRRGKAPEEIAEELEEEAGEIRRIYDAVAKHLPEYDPEEILGEISGNTAAVKTGENQPGQKRLI